MPSQQWWKDFYGSERERLGRAYLERLIEDAPEVPLGRALVFPHTRLAASGHQTAAVAKAVSESRCDTVLTIGVLHGVRHPEKRPAGAPASTRGIYSGQDTITRDEFSLDNFEALLSTAAEMAGVKPPVIIKRYPLLTGDDPWSLEGFAEMMELIAGGAALVATADLIHHGIGYDTTRGEARDPELASTKSWAEESILENLLLLGTQDFAAFDEHCLALRSDFRDGGPVLAALLGTGWKADLLDLKLVDYSDVLEAAAPTWVAAGLIACR